MTNLAKGKKKDTIIPKSQSNFVYLRFYANQIPTFLESYFFLNHDYYYFYQKLLRTSNGAENVE